MDILEFPDGSAWQAWLDTNHTEQSEAWLRIGKRHAGIELIGIGDALDGALCHGWIDGQRRAYDERSFLQRYSRRRPKSSWSKVNVEKVARLTDAGLMRRSGLAEVEASKADGRWESAYEPQRTATVPDDLAAALTENRSASEAFERLGRSERYAVMLPLLKTTTPESRAKALAREITVLARSRRT